MVKEQFPLEDPAQMRRDGYFLYEIWLPDLSHPVMQEKLARHNGNIESVIDEDETMMWVDHHSSWIFDEEE